MNFIKLVCIIAFAITTLAWINVMFWAFVGLFYEGRFEKIVEKIIKIGMLIAFLSATITGITGTIIVVSQILGQ